MTAQENEGEGTNNASPITNARDGISDQEMKEKPVTPAADLFP